MKTIATTAGGGRNLNYVTKVDSSASAESECAHQPGSLERCMKSPSDLASLFTRKNTSSLNPSETAVQAQTTQTTPTIIKQGPHIQLKRAPATTTLNQSRSLHPHPPSYPSHSPTALTPLPPTASSCSDSPLPPCRHLRAWPTARPPRRYRCPVPIVFVRVPLVVLTAAVKRWLGQYHRQY